jgi:hypothetical protein
MRDVAKYVKKNGPCGQFLTRKWWPGGEVRVAPLEVERIDWNEGKMHLRLTREELRARR